MVEIRGGGAHHTSPSLLRYPSSTMRSSALGSVMDGVLAMRSHIYIYILPKQGEEVLGGRVHAEGVRDNESWLLAIQLVPDAEKCLGGKGIDPTSMTH